MYGAFDGLCSEVGFQAVDTNVHCREAISILQRQHFDITGFDTEEDSASYPSGCYIHSNKYAYWNTHPTGSSHICGDCQSICKTKRKYCKTLSIC